MRVAAGLEGAPVRPDNNAPFAGSVPRAHRTVDELPAPTTATGGRQPTTERCRRSELKPLRPHTRLRPEIAWYSRSTTTAPTMATNMLHRLNPVMPAAPIRENRNPPAIAPMI